MVSEATADADPKQPTWVPVALAVNAIALPTLLALNLPPSSTFLNQAAAFIGWGALLTVEAATTRWAAARWSAGRVACRRLSVC